ncbi:Uncharacterised protein [Streptococcus pneumoniae]|nr:Uncharacterised protein [Streptococcus pneumoniae]
MMPVSFNDEQARNNMNGPIRNHILFDENHTPRWFDQYITQHNIIEVPAERYDEITHKDMLIYYISDSKKVTFKRSQRTLPKEDHGVYGILKNVYDK